MMVGNGFANPANALQSRAHEFFSFAESSFSVASSPRRDRNSKTTHFRATCELENALGGAVRKFYS